MVTESLSSRFAEHYRGRHRPEDALWWLVHPSRPGPSGTPPIQHWYLAAVVHLEDNGDVDLARALQDALANVLDTDRRAALDALHEAREARPHA